jgi:hypothetical protein
MNGGAEVISSALTEAEKPGDELAPSKLLEIIIGLPDPIAALSDFDLSNEIFEAIHDQFGFVNIMRAADRPPGAEDKQRLVALLRWVVREFQEWREADDTLCQKLTALFIITRYCDMGGMFWSTFPPELESNFDLLTALGKLIGRFSYNLSVRDSRPVPIWESEAIERFKQADAQGDWLTIDEMWPQLEHVIVPNAFLGQAVRCLHRFGFHYLVQALNDIHQTVIAMEVTGALFTSQRLELGLASGNPYIEFGSVYKTVFQRSEGEHLTGEKQKSLAQLLAKITGDASRWREWMHLVVDHLIGGCLQTDVMHCQPYLAGSVEVAPVSSQSHRGRCCIYHWGCGSSL